jgi:hypothetical protein
MDKLRGLREDLSHYQDTDVQSIQPLIELGIHHAQRNKEQAARISQGHV